MSKEPLPPVDAEATRREDRARARYFAVGLVRLGGVFVILFGILMMLERLSWAQGDTARYAGFALSVGGLAIYAILTRMMLRRWASPRDKA